MVGRAVELQGRGRREAKNSERVSRTVHLETAGGKLLQGREKSDMALA